MSGSNNQKKGRTRKKSTATKSNSRKTSTKRMSAAEKKRLEEQFKIRQEVMFLVFFALSILLTLCTIRITNADGTKSSIIGSFGDVLSGFEFGVFGFMAYAAPILLFLGIVFSVINQGLVEAKFKLGASIGLFLIFDIFAAFFCGIEECGTTVAQYYAFSKNGKGGGVVGAVLGQALHRIFGMVGTIALLIVLMIICFVLLTEKSFINGVKRGSRRVYETAKDDAARRRDINERRREEQRLRRLAEEEAAQNEPLKRMERKVTGVSLDVTIPREAEPVENIHELTSQQSKKEDGVAQTVSFEKNPEVKHVLEEEAPVLQFEAEEDPLAHIQIKGLVEEQNDTYVKNEQQTGTAVTRSEPVITAYNTVDNQDIRELHPINEKTAPHKLEVVRQETPRQEVKQEIPKTEAAKPEKVTVTPEDLDISEDIKQQQEQVAPKKEYVLPPLDLLQKSENKSGVDSAKQLKETALHLQETLRTFGVNVTITDISQGPAVTRYELQPEQGVKVSKIVNLADDIKLNLAATDIRIEAPIPGKAAIGIEVPNKENTVVAFRDLIETKNYEEFPSKLSFAVGKDIGGQTVVTDIAKMPHLLIAGSTGSGKSVCINTLIMSILYKAHPDEVKLIMIDPKVVELSVYNGIPHLMIPVVTDPKKAAGALAWGVAEMTERYKKFADFGVRDLKGYNQKVEAMETNDGAPLPEKMPQIVIIVDELADLMMVAPGEVEESICRLAQLARAAGIHLVIATQRPSVDVITGLIKANMPSRIAFAVSSGVDSRTILDMNGAEKLLGKGDMLFYPQGLSKPARVQGAFVSDKEVSDVVDFLKNQCGETTYASEVEQKISAGVTAAGAGVYGSDGGSDRDVYFYDAGTFIIEKDKASIGMLQRVFKIGFNRAARIMDQLAQAGVVGEEEGTKPRKVLMTQEQFEQLIEEGA